MVTSSAVLRGQKHLIAGALAVCCMAPVPSYACEWWNVPCRVEKVANAVKWAWGEYQRIVEIGWTKVRDQHAKRQERINNIKADADAAIADILTKAKRDVERLTLLAEQEAVRAISQELQKASNLVPQKSPSEQ